jgi:agmatinase
MTPSEANRFLAARDPAADASWRIIGLPYDAASSYRRGAAYGPAEIRIASQSIESYSPYCRRDLETLAFSDAGDLEIRSLSPDDAVAAIREFYRKEGGRGIFALGGDHTVTCGAVEGLLEAGRGFSVLHLDAHLDLREEYTGGRYSHACVARRIAERLGPEHLIQWGMRSGERVEFEWAVKHGTYFGREAQTFRTAVRKLREGKVYLSLDLDLFEPAELPGVGNPEPGGVTFREFIGLLEEIRDLDIIAADVVELAPPWDPTGRSSVTAAEIIRELLLNIIHHG